MSVSIDTARFRLRELGLDDVTDRYLSWLTDQDARRYITAAAATLSLETLRSYVAERTTRSDVLFLGIFDKESGTHIGNIKYEPVDTDRGFAIMGVLIGDVSYRGRGVTSEVLAASCAWLCEHRGIREVVLGVKRDNARAIRAYEKLGFVESATPHIAVIPTDSMTMVWLLGR